MSLGMESSLFDNFFHYLLRERPLGAETMSMSPFLLWMGLLPCGLIDEKSNYSVIVAVRGI